MTGKVLRWFVTITFHSYAEARSADAIVVGSFDNPAAAHILLGWYAGQDQTRSALVMTADASHVLRIVRRYERPDLYAQTEHIADTDWETTNLHEIAAQQWEFKYRQAPACGIVPNLLFPKTNLRNCWESLGLPVATPALSAAFATGGPLHAQPSEQGASPIARSSPESALSAPTEPTGS